MKETEKYMKVTFVYSKKKKKIMEQIGQFMPILDLTMVCLKKEIVMIPSEYSSCCYIFHLRYLKKEYRDLGCNSTGHLLFSD